MKHLKELIGDSDYNMSLSYSFIRYDVFNCYSTWVNLEMISQQYVQNIYTVCWSVVKESLIL